MYKFSLTSNGYKILAVITSVAMMIFCSLLIVYHNQIPWFAIIFTALVVMFCCFACILCFTHRIVVNHETGKIIIANFRKHIVDIATIKNISIRDNPSLNPEKYCNLVVSLIDDSILVIPGYCSILKKGDVQKTRIIVSRLNNVLNK